MKYYLPAIVWAILIFSLSTNAAIELPRFTLLSPDKVGHFIAYCILTVLLVVGLAKQQQWLRWQWRWMFLAALVASAYGAGLEFVQAQLPYRSFDYADMLANAIGSGIGLVGILVLKRFILVQEGRA